MFTPLGVIYISNPVPLIVTGMLFYRVYGQVSKWIFNRTKGTKEGTGSKTLDDAIAEAGYAYDNLQDIFYSVLNPWQRKMGYCRIYDEIAAPTGMIVDSEPICFNYGGKRWLIEFWKGQYDLTCGCEIGVYTTDGPDLNIPGVFNGTFYYSASDAELLQMSYSLKRNGEYWFSRKDKHWWLTGFKLGEYSEPLELVMDISITLQDEKMRDAFVEELRKVGYSEININQNTVEFTFDKPYSPQPITRTKETDWIIQKKNKLMCDMYQKITGPFDNFRDKMNALQVQAPNLYETALGIGKSKKVFEINESIMSHINNILS